VIDFSRRQRGDDCVSDLKLDRLVAGETRDAAVDAHVAGCSACSARVEQLRRERVAAAALVGDGVQRILRAQRRRRVLVGAQAFLAAAVILLIVWPRPRDSERVKGSGAAVELDIIVRHADGRVVDLQPGGRVQPGEAIRFRVSTARPGRLAILGLDAAPKVTPYLQEAIAQGRKQVMPGSIVLDDTLGAERVVALLCDASVDAAVPLATAKRKLVEAGGDPRRVGALALPGCDESALVMEKSRR
jgi:hypothetical protein